MKLIIAEKPSLARNIVGAIGNMRFRDGYYENNEYFVTYAFGHLFSLCDIEDYTGPTKNGRWSMENIPCFPDEFKFSLKKSLNKEVDSGVLKQFKTIEALCNNPKVDEIVNAGDADREGEIIVRLCIRYALKTKKKLTRLWLPDQTVETINEGLKDLLDDNNYDNLANEGFARTYIDWLYGVNLTRYATLKTGTLLRVGRVIVPIVKAIYDRDMAITNFVSEKYFSISSKEQTKGEDVELNSTIKFKFDELSKCEEMCQKYNNCKAIVISKKVKKDTLSAGKLYSLSKLQNVLGKKYKMPMEESLNIVQKLYEAGYVTYPRTNSEYLATAEKKKINQIIDIIAKIGYPIKFKDNKTIFDDSKIESHSALTPTYKIPKKESLSEMEMKVYQTIFRRFVAVFCSNDCIVNKSELKIKVGDFEEFNLKGTIMLEPGWTKYDDYSSKDKALPNLNKGDEVNILFKPKEKETTPPKHYTIETLNNYLKNPFKDDKKKNDDSDDDDYKAMFEGLELGTEATRTGIIDNAKNSNYIALKKDVYTILPNGIYMIEQLMQMGISMDKYKTATIGQALKKVFHNEIAVVDSVKLAEKEISDIFTNKNLPIEEEIDTGLYKDVIGKCPLCNDDVVKGRYNYGCMGYKSGCKFKINFVICKRIISINNAKMLLSTGETSKIKGFVSKNNKLFDAKLKLQDGQIVFDFS
mgnify:FL=1